MCVLVYIYYFLLYRDFILLFSLSLSITLFYEIYPIIRGEAHFHSFHFSCMGYKLISASLTDSTRPRFLDFTKIIENPNQRTNLSRKGCPRLLSSQEVCHKDMISLDCHFESMRSCRKVNRYEEKKITHTHTRARTCESNFIFLSNSFLSWEAATLSEDSIQIVRLKWKQRLKDILYGRHRRVFWYRCLPESNTITPFFAEESFTDGRVKEHAVEREEESFYLKKNI